MLFSFLVLDSETRCCRGFCLSLHIRKCWDIISYKILSLKVWNKPPLVQVPFRSFFGLMVLQHTWQHINRTALGRVPGLCIRNYSRTPNNLAPTLSKFKSACASIENLWHCGAGSKIVMIFAPKSSCPMCPQLIETCFARRKIWISHCSSVSHLAKPQKVYTPRSQSPLHFDIGNI